MITDKLFGREGVNLGLIQIVLCIIGGTLAWNDNPDIARRYLSLVLKLGVSGIVFLIPGVYLVLRIEKELIECTALLCVPRILSRQGVTWDTLAGFYESMSRPLLGSMASLATTEAKTVLGLVKEYCLKISPTENEMIETLLMDAKRTLPPRVGGSSVPNLLMFSFSLLGGTWWAFHAISRWNLVDHSDDLVYAPIVGAPLLICASALFFISVTLDGIRAIILLSRTTEELQAQIGLK